MPIKSIGYIPNFVAQITNFIAHPRSQPLCAMNWYKLQQTWTRLCDWLPDEETIPVIKRYRLRTEIRSLSCLFLIVDPEFLDMFSFSLRSGDSEIALKHPQSVVLSAENSKEKFFGDEKSNRKTTDTAISMEPRTR